MSDLPPWIVVCLREPLDAATLAARSGAEPSRYGVAFAGGFLGRIEPEPWPRRMIDTALAREPIDLGAATLVISGGTNELAREHHRRDLATRRALLAGIANIAPDAGIESAASMKMRRLMELVRALAPLATAVILPQGNHLAYPVATWIELSDSYSDADGYTFPLFSALKVRGDVIASTGMWTFGVPDVAMAATAAQRQERVAVVGKLQREMVAEGWWPQDGELFEGRTLRAAWDAIWIASPDEPPEQRAQFERFAQLRRILGPCVHYHDRGDVVTEHFLRHGKTSLAVTNGLSPTREISITSPKIGPWANDYLAYIARAFGGEREIKELDRIAIAGDGPIAAVVVWAFGHLGPLHAGDPNIELWDLLPVLPAELAEFRTHPNAQADWIDARGRLGDFTQLHDRWRA